MAFDVMNIISLDILKRDTRSHLGQARDYMYGSTNASTEGTLNFLNTNLNTVRKQSDTVKRTSGTESTLKVISIVASIIVFLLAFFVGQKLASSFYIK